METCGYNDCLDSNICYNHSIYYCLFWFEIMVNQQLTKHFNLNEFAVSSDNPELARNIKFSDVEIERIRFICAAYLEPMRKYFDMPINISSGKRSRELNNAIRGSSPNSHHMYIGNNSAVDIWIEGICALEISNWLLTSVITRKIIAYTHRNFVHISFPNGDGIYNHLEVKYE